MKKLLILSILALTSSNSLFSDSSTTTSSTNSPNTNQPNYYRPPAPAGDGKSYFPNKGIEITIKERS